LATVFSTHELHPEVSATLRARADLLIASSPDGAAILNEGAKADVLVVRAPIPPEYFAIAKNLRAAVRHGAGLDMIPVEAATRAGVLVANVPGANARTVAEHVIFSAIALLRSFRKMDRDLRSQGWICGRRHADSAHELTGRTVGIVGMGNIGREVHRIAHHGFGLSVVSHTSSPQNNPPGVVNLALDQMIEQADIIVLCCPLTRETEGLIGARQFSRMKRHALLVNVSRGAIIDEDTLVEALRDGRIGGAALDVFRQQPLALSHPLFQMDNVIITPHMAGITEESMLRMGSVAAEETIRILDGELPRNFCNREVVDAYRKRFP
jgi:D-3-phosphoglycerate dehydrogenase / 2-oxoglutarate reductase